MANNSNRPTGALGNAGGEDSLSLLPPEVEHQWRKEAEDEAVLEAPWGGSVAMYDVIQRGTTQLCLELEPEKKEKTWSDFLRSMKKGTTKRASKAADEIVSFFSHLSIGGHNDTASSSAEGSDYQPPQGVLGVSFQKYPIASYVKLPAPLQPFLQLPILDHYLIVGRPTADKSGGLELYRECCPKEMRAAAPFLIVIDEPGKISGGYKDPKGYIWVEMPLVSVFKLDVRGMKSVADYQKILSKKGRWNYKDRMKKFAASPLKLEYTPLQLGSHDVVDELWPLYKSTGERNGFCVLGQKDFYKFHLETPGLTLLTIRDTSNNNKLVTFCTGVHDEDTLMPQWCGTDYDNELSRKCATYFIMLYEFFRIAIEDPVINWVDLGASRRSVKEALGCKGYPVSAYIRCKNSVNQAVVETFAGAYFHPEELINDP